MPDRPDRTHASGFTLTEVLIVVFIIALMSSVVIMNLPEGESAAQSRADELVVDLNRASREAIVSGEPVALAVLGGAYRFERYRGGFWTPSGMMKGNQNGRLVIEVSREDDGSSQAARTLDPNESAAFERQIVFSPVGDATPATIALTEDENRIRIAVTANGDIERLTVDGLVVEQP